MIECPHTLHVFFFVGSSTYFEQKHSFGFAWSNLLKKLNIIFIDDDDDDDGVVVIGLCFSFFLLKF